MVAMTSDAAFEFLTEAHVFSESIDSLKLACPAATRTEDKQNHSALSTSFGSGGNHKLVIERMP